jgi:transforming growth factor-beta-induced protein
MVHLMALGGQPGLSTAKLRRLIALESLIRSPDLCRIKFVLNEILPDGVSLRKVRSTMKLRYLTVLVAFGLVAAACGGNSAETTTTSQATTTTEALGTIPEVAAAAGGFDTLLAAVGAAGLAETLSGEGPFTVFAPTDEAFAALPDGTLEALLADIPTLTEILLYHVVSGAVMAETVVGLESATTVQGSDVMISVENGMVLLNGTVQVIVTDIEASNGVIHVIDAVLLPPMDGEEPEALGTIPEVAAAAGGFDTLLAAVGAAGLAETLSGEGPFTVFAPTDEAFAALPDGTLEALLADIPTLTEILLYHVVSGAVLAETVVGLESATTVQGSDVMISVENGMVFLNGTVQVIVTDIEASNGVIHVIDAVLLPPAD